MKIWGQIKTKTMRKFLEKEKDRVVGLSIEGAGTKFDPQQIFIYTDSTVWCDSAGSGTFSGDTETKAIKHFYEEVRRRDGTDQGD
jgi:hypothetical protein